MNNVSVFKGGTNHEHRNGYWSFINVRLLIIFMFHGLIFYFSICTLLSPQSLLYAAFEGFHFLRQCILMHKVGAN